MKSLSPYLNFPGNCEEAMNFYVEAIGGKIEFLQRFGESPMDVPEEAKQKIMHASFRADNMFFMASDCMPNDPINFGNSVTLCLSLSDEDEQTRVFENLSAGGKVTMPLNNTFWGARFGMLTDKFGINWMLSCEKQK